MKEITVNTQRREEMIDITSRLQEIVSASGAVSGTLHVFVPHTTAAVTINENADPDVKRDILYKLNKEIPRQDGYLHGEGNSDSHVKASLFGQSEFVMIEAGRLVLGTWQGVYFCEFDGPRTRHVFVRVHPDA
jgi:secondary thiamine-phosphate synthase enzyme